MSDNARSIIRNNAYVIIFNNKTASLQEEK